MKRALKLGTRRSLLALAQSRWVASLIEERNPGVRVELVEIVTAGDLNTSTPLSRMEGRDFFVKELDEQLLARKVDLTVHSMKDLSLERPEGIALAAIPPREDPRDVIVFSGAVPARLARGEAIRIGTSSPRRLENIPSFLREALPREDGAPEPRIELVEIRGNVNTRLERIAEAGSPERKLDGVVLALAGLARLWRDPAGRERLASLVEGARWMVLPLTVCPTAPAQGALAIECRTDDAGAREAIAKLHDAGTAARVERERAVLREWGGGCHQRFGATCVGLASMPAPVTFIHGKRMTGQAVAEVRWERPARPAGAIHAWDGTAGRAGGGGEALPVSFRPAPGAAVFVAHSRAATPVRATLGACRIWTSGLGSWKKLARMGLWVEGSADGLGFEFLESTLREPVLGLPPAEAWAVLTHDQADGWKNEKVLATYRSSVAAPSEEARRSLRGATHVFWGSAAQFDALKDSVPERAHQACGPGRTAQRLPQAQVFPSVEEWRKWLGSV